MLTPYTLPEQYSDIDSTEKARELIKRAIESAYNLACLNALLGNKDKSRKWLDKSYQTMGLPPREYIENDKDLESVRDYDWFKGFLAKL